MNIKYSRSLIEGDNAVGTNIVRTIKIRWTIVTFSGYVKL